MAHEISRQTKNQVIRLFKNSRIDEAFSQISRLIEKYPGDHELHYIAGMIYASQHRYADALICFEQAVQLHPKDAESHFEIGIIHTILCRYQKALAAFNEARKFRSHERHADGYIRQIRRAAKPRDVTLSVCLIVKNEEKYLPTCLRSIQGVADEIVVVDTGSTDQSVRIAERFGAKIVHFEWNDHFADARNFAKKQATGDWILQIDADEELVPGDQNKVREFICQNGCDGAFLRLQNRTTSTFGEDQPTVHYLIRLFQNRPDIHYVNPVHETLSLPGKAVPTDITLIHHGYNTDAASLQQKNERNARILYARLQAAPDDVTNLFYLSMLHLGKGEFEQCEDFAKQVLLKLKPDDLAHQHLYLMSLKNLALIHIERQQYEEALECCHRAIEHNSNYLEPWYFLGLIHYRQGHYQACKVPFETFIQKYRDNERAPKFNLFAQSAGAYLYQCYHLLGKVYRKEKNYEPAQQMMAKTVEVNPGFWIGHAELGYLFREIGDSEKAVWHLAQAIKLAKNNPEVNRTNPSAWFDFLNALKHYKALTNQRNAKKAGVSSSS